MAFNRHKMVKGQLVVPSYDTYENVFPMIMKAVVNSGMTLAETRWMFDEALYQLEMNYPSLEKYKEAGEHLPPVM